MNFRAIISVAPFLLLARVASAQDGGDVATARDLGLRGVTLAEAGNCAEAIPLLESSEKLRHAPTTLGRLGECEIAVGRLVSGTENLRRVVREVLPPDAPPAFAKAQERAAPVLEAALPRLASMNVFIDNGDGTHEAIVDLKVTLDGKPLSLASLGVQRKVDPGDHEVKAVAPGYESASRFAKVAEGGSSDVHITMRIDPKAAKALADAKAADAAAKKGGVAAAPEASVVPAVVAFTIGGVGLAAGAVTGALALGEASKLKDACNGTPGRCPDTASNRDALASLSTKSTLSTVSFIVGGVGVATGIVLLAIRPGGGSTEVGVAPNGLVLRGRF